MSANTVGMLNLGGERNSGESVRKQNVLAACSIANIVKSSLGPVGLDKMLVDDVGDVTITNDGATILKMLDVEHPAAKILVQLAQLQDEEVGDGTTSVVIIAAALLKNADELISRFVHPTTIITGYTMACREACRYIQDNMVMDVTKLNKSDLINVAKTSLSSKIIHEDSDLFAKMAVDALMCVEVSGSKGVTYPVNAVNVLKAHGKSMSESMFIEGYALNCTVASQQMPRHIKKAKIAFLDFSLQKFKHKLGVQVILNDPSELEAIRQREIDIVKERIQKILATGANVILLTGGIDDVYMNYFVKANAMAVRRCKKSDLKTIAKATGGQLLLSLSDIEGEEVFDPQRLGYAEEVSQERICDDELIIIKGPKVHALASILLRGANDFFVDEMERSLHDALLVVKRVLEGKKVVPGAGACETALSIFLENHAVTLSSREQLAIAEFARAMLSIPKQLAFNAGLNSIELIARLRSCHHASQSKPDDVNYKWWGLDLERQNVADCRSMGILEPLILKMKILRLATEAAVTILRIDDSIKLAEEKQHGDEYDDQCG